MKTNLRYSNICLRALALLCLMMASVGAWAADYVIAYVNDGTTYYLARNGTTGVQRVTTFNPTTCVWSCEDENGTPSTLNNSNTYGWLYQTVNGTKYYLRGYSNDLTTDKATGNNNTTRWRTDGNTYVYNRYSNNYSFFINLQDGVARANTASGTCARSYLVSTGGTDFSVSISYPSSDAYIGNVGGTMTISAQVSGNYTPAYYRFNNKYYYTTNGTTYIEANTVPTVYQFDYTYDIISGGDNASITGNTVTYTKDAGEDVEVTVRVTATPQGYASVTRTKECTFTLRSATLAAPTITRIVGTNKYEITYPAGATARYRTDGTDINEYANNGTEYSDVITVTTPGAVIKARAVRDGVVSAQTEYTVSDVILDAPVISIAEDGTVTITNPNDFASDATVYYTTDGSDPSASPDTYSNSFIVTNGATIKAIIVKSGYTNSEVAEERYMVSSGVSGGTVTINDYEDHTWTYYAGVPTDVDGGLYNTNYLGKLYSPNPRNVKITYYGKGRVATTDSVNGDYIDISNNSSYTVQVGINAPENTFVYYKTLERDNNSRYPYTTIPNPFSVRPVYGTNTTTKWRGFYRWRIKSVSDGGIYAATTGGDPLGVGSYLEPDKEYFFQPSDYNNDNYTINGTSMTVELEAVWARAYVNTSNSTTNFVSKANGGWERNFVVYTSGTGNTATGNANYPITYTALYPNGSTTNNGEMATAVPNVSVESNMTLKGDVKIENIRMNGGSTLGASYKNLWIGHGVTGTGTDGLCATLINGGTTTSTASPQYHIRIESGVYQYMSFFTGYYKNAGGDGGSGFTVTGSNTNAKITLGCDYDRASKANTNLQFQDGLSLGRSGSFANGNRANKHTLDLTIKSGRLAYNFFSEVANTDAKRQGGAGYGFYLSSGGSQTYMGTRNVLIEGGEMATIGSGIDSYNNTTGTSTTPSTTTNYGNLGFNFRMRGGVIHGNVYGGAAKSPAGGNRVMVVTGGQIKGWFAAGCNGTDSDGGQTYGTSWVYIGGSGKIDSEGNNTKLGYASGGNVYAAGAGMTDAETCGEMTFGTNLVLADDGYVERGVYGGGNYGYAKASTNIYITGGTNEGKTDTQSSNAKGGVYGGANQQDGPGINIWMTGGKMYGGVYGGCNTKGTITGDVTMQINGGQVGQDAEHTENIHGGGYGQLTVVNGSVDITLGKTGAARDADGVTVWGDVYGGSALGLVNATATNDRWGRVTYSYTNNTYTNVTMNAGYVHGSLYGGALGSNTVAANVYGPVAVTVNGGSVFNTDGTGANGSGAVYGANNINGAPQRSVTVDIYGTNSAPAEGEYALFSVYGGGNQANYTYGNGYPKVTVHNCDNSIEYVYGGGNAAAVAATDVTIYGGNKIGNVFGGGNGQVRAANVNGNTNVKIYGGIIGDVYGGSNTDGTIGGTISVTVNKTAEDGGDGCDMKIDNVYGGGNHAPSAAGSITIGCTGDAEEEGIGNVYGGANAANISSSITLNITGGKIDNVFGGNNADGVISGDVTVNITGGQITNVFGENNAGGNVAGKVTVNIDMNATDACGKASTLDYVYGGGQDASYTPTTPGDYPEVNLIKGVVNHDVFGGGLGSGATVTSNPTVNMRPTEKANFTVLGNIYGGGSAAPVVGSTSLTISNGTIGTMGSTSPEGGYVFGGGLGQTAVVSGDTRVQVKGSTYVEKNVYGGGNGGEVMGDTKVIIGE